MPNLQSLEETVSITFDGETVYEPPFGLCGLSDDETAMAQMMVKTGAFARGEGESPYPLSRAIIDAYTDLMVQESIRTGEVISADQAFLGEKER